MTCSNDFGGDRVGHGAVDGHDGSGLIAGAGSEGGTRATLGCSSFRMFSGSGIGML